MFDVTVIDDPAAAEASLDPIRSRLLAELADPGSATTLATRVGLPRQKVNYHLRALERHGLVELVEERRKGNVTERWMQATAAAYVISPVVLAAVEPDPARARDQLSARWLLALAGQLVKDVGLLITRSAKARQRVATYGMDGEVRFASAADRAAFADELTKAVTALVAKYHDESAPGGREHRVVVAVHPSITKQSDPPAAASSESIPEPRSTDMSHPFNVTHEITVDATPEQVWDAIATGPGIDSWFMGKNEIEPREGGRGSFSIMGDTSGTTVTAWEPGRRFEYRSDDDDEGNFMAFAYLIEGREGGSTVVRFVHSGFLGDDWKTEYDALSIGDGMYLRKLGVYVENFAPRTSRWSLFLPGPQVQRAGAGWDAFTDAFGLSRDAKPGDSARIAIDGVAPSDGVVEFTHGREFLCIRSDDSLYMFMHGHMDMVFVEQHSFAETVGGTDEQQSSDAWQAWMSKTFA